MKKRNFLILIVILIWCCLTLLRVLYHQPWYDEAHAYMLVQNYSFLDLISEMREEGHLMVWYLLIMPFAKLKLWYPYPMQILNWLFAFAALLIMWKKAPFHPVTKFIITFSYPFLAELPVVARCYAVGVVLLFLIASLYKNALKHPIWYAVLIALCANTSVMALFGASAFGFVFAYDLIKGALAGNVSRKDFRIAFSVLALSAVLVLWQIGGSIDYQVPNNSSFIINFSSFIYGNGIPRLLPTKYFITLSIYLVMIFTPIILLLKSRKLFIIGFFVFSGMMYCFLYKYSGYSQHYIFFWIYTLIIYWLLIESERINTGKKSKLMIMTELVLILFWGVQLISTEMKNNDVYHSHTRTMALKIKNAVEKNSRVILVKGKQSALFPYLERDDIEIYTYIKGAPVGECKNFFNSAFYTTKDDKNLYIYPSWLKKLLSKTKNNYMILAAFEQNRNIEINDKRTSMLFKPVVFLGDGFALYRITEVKGINEKQ